MREVTSGPAFQKKHEHSDDVRDYSQAIVFDLRKEKPKKTIDIGHAGTSLSLDACGRVRNQVPVFNCTSVHLHSAD